MNKEIELNNKKVNSLIAGNSCKSKSGKSLKESNDENTLTSLKDDNILLYNDDKVMNDIYNREAKRKREKEYKEKLKEKEEEKERKKLLTPISKISNLLLINCSLLIISIGLSLVCMKFNYVLYSIITIFLSIFIGKRLQINYDELFNVLLWNISQSIKDFIEFKIPYDLAENNDFKLFKTSCIFSILSIILNSTNVIYIISFAIVLLMFIVSLGYRNIEDIRKNSKLISIALLIGFVLKTVLYTIFTKTLTIDYMNSLLLNVFVAINYYCSKINIINPEKK